MGAGGLGLSRRYPHHRCSSRISNPDCDPPPSPEEAPLAGQPACRSCTGSAPGSCERTTWAAPSAAAAAAAAAAVTLRGVLHVGGFLCVSERAREEGREEGGGRPRSFYWRSVKE